MWKAASLNGINETVEPTEIKCSSCQAPLFAYVALPKEEKTYRINAECPFCGDKSFEIKVKGKLVFISTEYCHATPRPVYLPRESIADPLEYSDQINVKTEIRKPWRKK